MAYDPNRDDPYLAPRATGADEFRSEQRLEREAQADPELVEGPSSPGRVALYAIGILAVLGAVFYGLNAANNSSQTASSNPPATVAQGSPANTLPPGPPVRNVTPGPNTAPGTTTGAAPSTPPAPAPAPAQKQ